MDLDMYLNRAPRYKDATMKDVNAIEHYFDWKKAKARGSKHANCTLKEWCGIAWKDVPRKDYRDFYSQFYNEKYYDWDTERQYPSTRIPEQVGYWRKANHIHQWFVDNIQNGIDDCSYHDEVTKEKLEKLLDVCQKVLSGSKLVSGKVYVGASFQNGTWTENYEDGLIVEDSSVAEKLLPTQSGFFFGGTQYDEWYFKDVEDTIDIITKVLATTDFENEMIYYCSSW